VQVELLLKWIKEVLRYHGRELVRDPSAVPVSHLLQKVVSSKLEFVRKTARENLDLMNFLCGQP
jgi:hypothetical protein